MTGRSVYCSCRTAYVFIMCLGLSLTARISYIKTYLQKEVTQKKLLKDFLWIQLCVCIISITDKYLLLKGERGVKGEKERKKGEKLFVIVCPSS